MLHILAPGKIAEATLCYAESAQTERVEGPVVLVQENASLVSLGWSSQPVGYLSQAVGGSSHLAVISRSAGLFCAAVTDGFRSDGELVVSSIRLRHGSAISLTPDGVRTPDGLIPAISRSSPGISAAACRSLRLAPYATVSTAAEVQSLDDAGISGIGSIRMEHLLIGTPEQRHVAATLAHLVGSRPARADEGLEWLGESLRVKLVDLLRTCEPTGIPVTIRLPDFDLEELLEPSMLRELRGDGVQLDGLRGAMLNEHRPALLAVATRSICSAVKQTGIPPHQVTIVIPYVSRAAQVDEHLGVLHAAEREAGLTSGLRTGVMIETPAAALQADQFARRVDCFILGTNDLTALVSGQPRSVTTQAERHPLALIEPVVDLLTMAVERGRSVNADLVVGACGETAAFPDNLRVFAGMGIDFVSPPVRLFKESRRDTSDL